MSSTAKSNCAKNYGFHQKNKPKPKITWQVSLEATIFHSSETPSNEIRLINIKSFTT